MGFMQLILKFKTLQIYRHLKQDLPLQVLKKKLFLSLISGQINRIGQTAFL